MPTRTPIVGGNWKMNTTGSTAAALAADVAAGVRHLNGVDVHIFPPWAYVQGIAGRLAGAPVAVGVQNVWPDPPGAFTGEASLEMARDVGATRVLVGHSERRHVQGEDDALINRKVRAVLGVEGSDLDVTLCVGETAAEREAGETESVVLGQLSAGLAGVSGSDLARVLIAYEPVWAIGTGQTASPTDAQAVHELIRRDLASRYDTGSSDLIRIQYGGSVKPSNAAALIAQSDIDGFLVGGASLHAGDFLAILRAAADHAATASTS